MKKYEYILVNFEGKVMGYKYYYYKNPMNAVSRGAKIIWLVNNCARVVIKSNWGFNMTVEWGVPEIVDL